MAAHGHQADVPFGPATEGMREDRPSHERLANTSDRHETEVHVNATCGRPRRTSDIRWRSNSRYSITGLASQLCEMVLESPAIASQSADPESFRDPQRGAHSARSSAIYRSARKPATASMKSCSVKICSCAVIPLCEFFNHCLKASRSFSIGKCFSSHLFQVLMLGFLR
jgi:hypothetical protein